MPPPPVPMPKTTLSLNTKQTIEYLRKGATAYWSVLGPYLILPKSKDHPQITYNIHLKAANCLLRNGILTHTRNYPRLAFKDIPYNFGEPKLPSDSYNLKPLKKRRYRKTSS